VAPTLPYRFISAFGSTVGVYMGCCWLGVVAAATRGLVDVAAAVLPASAATNGLVPVGCVELVLPELLGAMLESVWLMEMS